jgi:drug/metabolite transporter (DMT)-like permease
VASDRRDVGVPGIDRGALVALLLVQLFFGAFSVFGKVALREMTPFVLASFRALFGALLLSALAKALSPDEPPLDGKDRRTIAQLSLFGIVGNQLLFISGLARTTATNATLLGVTIPLFTIALAALSGAALPGLRRLAGIPVALAGVLLLLDLGKASFGAGHLAGNLLILCNCAAYSVFLVRSREILARRSAIAVIAACFRYGALPILLVAAGDLSRFEPSRLSGRAWSSVAFVVLLGTVGAYALNAWGLSRTSPSTAALFVYLQPLIAGVAAHAVLGEAPGPRTFTAALLIFGGLALASMPGRR